MTLQPIKGGLWIPGRDFIQASGGGATTYSALTIDAAAEKFAMIFQVPKTGTLDKFEFRTGTVASIGTSVLRCSFQDVGATTGDPDGTQDQFRDISAGSITSNTWMVPGLITSDGTDGGSKRSVTIGDLLACVVEFQTFSASASVALSYIGNVPLYTGSPYSDHYTGSWAKTYFGAIVIALKYNDGTYECVPGHAVPASALNSVSFNNGSTPDERGLKFKFPFPVKLKAAYLRATLNNDADLVLYDSDGSTVLMNISMDAQYDAGVGFVSNQFRMFDTEVSLSKDTFYRLTLKPTTASNVALDDNDVNAAEIMDATEGGQNFHYTQRTDAGAWTDTTTKRPWISLLVSAADDGTGGGGTTIAGTPMMRGMVA